MVKELRAILPALPAPMLTGFFLLIGSMLEGRAGVVLVRGGETMRFSFQHATDKGVQELITAYDEAFSDVPVAYDDREGADAKSTH
jgi:hypothetical protein